MTFIASHWSLITRVSGRWPKVTVCIPDFFPTSEGNQTSFDNAESWLIGSRIIEVQLYGYLRAYFIGRQLLNSLADFNERIK